MSIPEPPLREKDLSSKIWSRWFQAIKSGIGDHHTDHQNGGIDEINIAGLSGLLADDQHILDAEVLSYLLAQTGAGANKKLFITAAGAGVEWATGLKVLTVSRDLSLDADQAITGVGFKPNAVIALVTVNDAASRASWGFTAGTTNLCISDYGLNTANAYYSFGNLITIYTAAGANRNDAIVNSWDSDGITLDWTKAGVPAGTATFQLLFLR